METNDEYLKGRGAQVNIKNRFEKREYTTEHIEGIDEPFQDNSPTQYIINYPKKIINKVESPDIPGMYSMNPYQGCEHGCIYCYARNSHQYWGYSAGLDFERKIMVKENAPELLRKAFDNLKWVPQSIMLSGNTDCYQPIERKTKITRRMLEVLLEYRNPVSIITKNSLILRDKDILQEMAAMNLVHVNITITALDESIRLKMEPRTATYKQRLNVVEELSKLKIPVNIMVAPIVPSITDYEVPGVIKAAAERGALSAAYTIVRLNGAIADIFTDWVHKNYPDRAAKVLNQIAACHGGQLNDSRWGLRTRGEGNIAEAIRNLFVMARNKYMKDRVFPSFDYTNFRRPQKGQLSLF